MRNMRMSKYGNSYNYTDILLSEFKFYNKTKKIINEEELKKIQEKLINNPDLMHIFWTNDIFAKQNIGFKISKKIENNQKEFYINIIETPKKFKAEEFNSCKDIFEKYLFITCNLTEIQKDIILNFRSIDDNNCKQDNEENIKILNSWEEIIDYLIENKLINNWHYDPDDWEDFKSSISDIMFPNILDKEPKYEIVGKRYHYPKIGHIIKVIEKRINNKNYRIALINLFEGYNSTIPKLLSISEDDKDYNYIDENRIYLIEDRNKNYYFLDSNLNEYNNDKLIINLDFFNEINNNIQQLLGQDQKVITPMIYRFYKDRVEHYENYNESGAYTTIEKQILEQYKKLLKNNKTIKIDNVTISRTRITVDEYFDIQFEKTFLNVIDNVLFIKKKLTEGDMRFNFNALYEEILKLSSLKIVRMTNTHLETYKNFKKMEFKLNDLFIKVEKENNRIKINGIFCRIDDVFKVLTRAICYRTQKEYNKYIKEVSHIGMDWKLMISTGLSLEIKNPFYHIFNKIGKTSLDKTYVRFSLLWDSERRQKVYLLLNSKKYLIRYKGKFKRYFNYPRKIVGMNQLKKELSESIEKLDDDTFLEIIENATKEAKIIKERGAKLVKETIKEINAIKDEIEIRGGKIQGYLIKGKLTGSDYFVEGNSLEVYKKMDGVWNRRCVVDDPTKNRIFEDRLANRLINIANEPKKIFTLFN